MASQETKRVNYTERVTILVTKIQKDLINEKVPNYQRGKVLRDFIISGLNESSENISGSSGALDNTEMIKHFSDLAEEVSALRAGQNAMLVQLNKLSALMAMQTEGDL